MLIIDGSQGEGGGQVLRTSLSLAALTGRPFTLTKLRANRKQPGLRPQHLTAVRAVAAVCGAALEGDAIHSQTLVFEPQVPPQGSTYRFDVADAAQGGSAGAVTLIWQALIWPLLFAPGKSHVTLHGGSHVPFSPPFHYLSQVLLPLLHQFGVESTLELNAWGWYPVGGGAVTAVIQPTSQLHAPTITVPDTKSVNGVAAVTNLPAHIPQRMANRAHNLLVDAGFVPNIEPVRQRGRGPGAGIVLWLPNGGFTSLGRQGLPADQVAETAVTQLLAFARSGMMVDEHLADQLMIPAALAHGTTCYTTHRLTRHALTNADLLRQWLGVSIQIDGQPDQPAEIVVAGVGFQRDERG
ncbi:MAG: RNA 3'-phosphate cyclase [Anaerolineaceae bacterium]|nr:RNA 3'-phosphate cyclase [Anaerolineaceae bacterium]